MTFSNRAMLITGATALLLLISSYALGYRKGASKQQPPPQATFTSRQTDATQKSQEKSRSVRDITADENIVETRLQLPEILMPDGSRKSQVHITRSVASKETVEATRDKETEVKIVEKIVERKVEVPGPCPEVNALLPVFPPERPRFSLGPSVGRNFQTDKNFYGGAAGLRVAGPVWLRVAADSQPSVSAGAEVQF